MAKIDRSKVVSFFTKLEKHGSTEPPKWTRSAVPSCLKALLGSGVGFWVSAQILPGILYQVGMDRPSEVAETIGAICVLIMVVSIIICLVAGLQSLGKYLAGKKQTERAQKLNHSYLEEFRRAKLHDLLRARKRAFGLTRLDIEDLKEFDAPDLYEKDDDPADATILEQLVKIGRHSVFFFGPAPWNKTTDVVRVETGSEIVFETNPIVTATLFLSDDQIVIVQSTLDLKRGMAMEECVSRLFLSDLVRIQFRENRIPLEVIGGGDSSTARERQMIEDLKKQISEGGAGLYRKVREIVMTHTDQGTTVLPIGGRVILEKEVPIEETGSVGSTREDEVVKVVDERLLAAKRSMFRRLSTG
ncbi:MAG: hypothetical protein KGS60_14745 [Verrucomicrobia bacterium]|nr:hypothetical protein [Verrucomicrobiota bacterium]